MTACARSTRLVPSCRRIASASGLGTLPGKAGGNSRATSANCRKTGVCRGRQSECAPHAARTVTARSAAGPCANHWRREAGGGSRALAGRRDLPGGWPHRPRMELSYCLNWRSDQGVGVQERPGQSSGLSPLGADLRPNRHGWATLLVFRSASAAEASGPCRLRLPPTVTKPSRSASK